MKNRIKMNWSKLAVVALAAAASLGWTVSGAMAQSGLTPITFSLDFIPLGRHAAWYAAKEEGYFADAGLDVTIIPAQGTAQVMQALASNTAQFGFVDLTGVVLARASGTDLKMLAVNYQKAPYAIFSLADGANVTSAAQLENLSLGSGAGSITPRVIAGFMAEQGLDGSTLDIVNVAPPARAGALITRQVPAIEFFVMSTPGLEKAAEENGTSLTTYLLADNGLELYSNGIGAMSDYVENNPEIARNFVDAALRGWQFTLRNPEIAADHIMKNVDGLDKNVILAEIAIVENLVVNEDVANNGLGYFSVEGMEQGVAFVIDNVEVEGTAPTAADVFVEGFLPAEPYLP